MLHSHHKCAALLLLCFASGAATSLRFRTERWSWIPWRWSNAPYQHLGDSHKALGLAEDGSLASPPRMIHAFHTSALDINPFARADHPTFHYTDWAGRRFSSFVAFHVG
jgi:hypothetical protein